MTASGPPPAEAATDQPLRLRLIILLGCLASFAPLSIDMYLPALPQVATSLHTTATSVQLTLTACLVGIGLGQLVAGPVSDRFGRRRPLLIGIGMFTVFSLACALAPTLPLLLLARLLQALGGSAGIVISRAVARDLRSGEALARLFSVLMVVNGLAPVLAPLVGGQLIRFTSWRGDFVVLAGLGAALLVATVTILPESLPPSRRRPGGVTAAAAVYRQLLGQRAFVAMVLSGGLAFAALFTYISGSPFVLEQHFGLSAQTFSVIFGINALMIIVGARVKIGDSARTMQTGLLIITAGAVAAVVALAVGIGLPLLLPAFVVLMVGYGMVGPTSTALALTDHPHAAGSAAAIYGVNQYLVGGLLAPLGGLGGRPLTVALVITGCAVSALGVGTWALVLRGRVAAAGGAEPHSAQVRNAQVSDAEVRKAGQVSEAGQVRKA